MAGSERENVGPSGMPPGATRRIRLEFDDNGTAALPGGGFIHAPHLARATPEERRRPAALAPMEYESPAPEDGDEATDPGGEPSPEESTAGNSGFDADGVMTLPSGVRIVAPAMASSTSEERLREARRQHELWLAGDPNAKEPWFHPDDMYEGPPPGWSPPESSVSPPPSADDSPASPIGEDSADDRMDAAFEELFGLPFEDRDASLPSDAASEARQAFVVAETPDGYAYSTSGEFPDDDTVVWIGTDRSTTTTIGGLSDKYAVDDVLVYGEPEPAEPVDDIPPPSGPDLEVVLREHAERRAAEAAEAAAVVVAAAASAAAAAAEAAAAAAAAAEAAAALAVIAAGPAETEVLAEPVVDTEPPPDTNSQSGGTKVGGVIFDDNGVATLSSGAKIIAPAFAKSTPLERQQAAARRYEEWLASGPDEDYPPHFYDD